MVKIIVSNLHLAFFYLSLKVSLSFVSDALNKIRVHLHVLLFQLSSKRKGKKIFKLRRNQDSKFSSREAHLNVPLCAFLNEMFCQEA